MHEALERLERTEDGSRKLKAAYVDGHSCRAVCLCVHVQSDVFPEWEKGVAIVKIAVCLSAVSVIA